MNSFCKSSPKCSASTGIHDDGDGTPEHPYGLTFGYGELDYYGYWQYPCAECARHNEQIDNVPLGSYWPFPNTR